MSNYLKVSLVCLFIVSFLIRINDGTLSKSDKDKKKQQQKKEKQVASGIVDPAITYSDVLKNHFRVDYGEPKKFPNAVLGYVTPWNNHGYDVAKFLSHKFTHISPVWFQVNYDEDMNACVLGGTHDMDQGWIKDVRKNNSALKIVPRFLFERWTPLDFQKLLTYEDDQNRCADVVLDFMERNRLDGGVIEIWVQVQGALSGKGARELVHLVTNMAEHFKARKKEFILAVPPTVAPGPTNEYRRTFLPDHFVQLASYVDYFSLMLYDFPGEKAGPVAPINWVRINLETLIDSRPDARRKLLMGMNFYGYDYHPTGVNVEPITGTQYLRLLDNTKPDIMWNQIGSEHYFLHKGHVIYYPTLSSLETRLNLAQELGVGVAIWETGQGLDYFYNLF